MAKKRPHTGLDHMPASDPMDQAGDYPRGGLGGNSTTKTPQQPTGEVSTQKRGGGGTRTAGPDVYERGQQPMRYRERTPSGGRQSGLTMNTVSSAMPRTGQQSVTAPGALARPGSERNSATMDARSSVASSIQEGPNTRDRFGSLSHAEKNQREDRAELDDGCGTGRRSRGTFRGGRRM